MSKRKVKLLALLFVCLSFARNGECANDSLAFRSKLAIPLLDFPQNFNVSLRYPSMYQSLCFSKSGYELAFAGIQGIGDRIFYGKNRQNRTLLRKWGNGLFSYSVGLAFSRYGSELPIPFGVWAHEEFHRSVLAVNHIASKNGNWLFSRWDGTVFGVSDQQLAALKQSSLQNLLYAYTAGVQYEVLLNENISTEQFFENRKSGMQSLLLYNSWYAYNYFRFSTSAVSDSVKVIAPRYESSDPKGRDFAGADLTAWAYDMFNPDSSFYSRSDFPGGWGENRRIGFADLSNDAQNYLQKQKKLSLLNFVNPQIFFLRSIKIGSKTGMNFFAQYNPAPFGNAVAASFLFSFRKAGLQFMPVIYSNYERQSVGIQIGIYGLKISENSSLMSKVYYWNQPENFFGRKIKPGAGIELLYNFQTGKRIDFFVRTLIKTSGWLPGNPYLDKNLQFTGGVQIRLFNEYNFK